MVAFSYPGVDTGPFQLILWTVSEANLMAEVVLQNASMSGASAKQHLMNDQRRCKSVVHRLAVVDRWRRNRGRGQRSS